MNAAIMPNYVNIAWERVTALALFVNAFLPLKINGKHQKSVAGHFEGCSPSVERKQGKYRGFLPEQKTGFYLRGNYLIKL